LFWDLTCEFAGVFEGVFKQKKSEVTIRTHPAKAAEFVAGRTVIIPPIAKCSIYRALADFRVVLTLLAVLNAGMWFIDRV
jgi:hypothetical protein